MTRWYRSDRRFRVRSRFKDPSLWRKKWKRLSRAASNWLDGHPVDDHDQYALILLPAAQATRTASKKVKGSGKARKREVEEKDTEDMKKEGRPPMRFIAIPWEPSTKRAILAREAEYRDREDEYSPQDISNHIQTAKYSLLTFIPKNLAEQFRRVANVYFLVLVLLQAIPILNNFNIGLASIPLVSILIVTAIKDGIEDWRRHKSDNHVNYCKAYRLHRACHQNQKRVVDGIDLLGSRNYWALINHVQSVYIQHNLKRVHGIKPFGKIFEWVTFYLSVRIKPSQRMSCY